MACEFCHKPKFVQGKIYQRAGRNELFIYALVGWDKDCQKTVHKLISLDDGNRYSDEFSELKEARLWKEVPNALYR